MDGEALTCAACGTENRADRRFCRQCGAALGGRCPVCGASNEIDDRFCGACGSALEAASASAPRTSPSSTAPGSPATPSTERRLVSILFVDLVDFTRLSESTDAEDVQALQRRYLDRVREIVERYGGTVEKFIGDAVMAVWGTPVAFEDDAERAVRAALDVVDAVGRIEAGPEIHLVARAAVMTGETAVTVGATDQGMVSGDLVNSAARLQGQAPSGTILVGEVTRRATEAAIAYEPAGTHTLKGKETAVAAWRPIGILSGRGGAWRSTELEPPFVGRDGELHLLKELLHGVVRERRASLVSIVGIAGIGKSRLAWELEKYIDGISETVYWHQGRSPAYGQGVAFWALGEMVRGRAGIAETDPESVALERLATALDTYVPDADDRRWLGPRLAGLLGLAEAPTTERSDLFAAWRAFFERVADGGPTIMVFEDLQWADQGLFDFVESLLEWSRDHSILIVTLARPEIFERRPTWGAGQRNFTALHLDPLPQADMTALMAGLAPGLPGPVAARIVERSEGVPLYAVETVRMLIGEGRLVAVDGGYRLDGVDELRVPETLQGIIGARLDALEPSDRSLVQDASVLGLAFSADALAAVSGRDVDAIRPRLGVLVRREIVRLEADPRSPERGQYAFVQGLLREVAYGTLARMERRARHLAAVRYFETMASDEIAPIVADHYLQAYQATAPGPEADALAAQARIALRVAGERAAALHSHVEALAFFEAALAITSDPSEAAELHERAGEAARAGVRPDSAWAHLSAAASAYRTLGDRRALARATASLGRSMQDNLAVDRALSLLEAGVAEAEGLGDDPGVAALLAELARAYMFQARNDVGLPAVDRALDMAERLELPAVIADALITKGNMIDDLGRPREAIALQRGAVALAEKDGLLSIQVRGLNNLTARLYGEDPGESWVVAQETLAVARRAGDGDALNFAVGFAAGFAVGLGRWDEALALIHEVDRPDIPVADRLAFDSARLAVLAYRGEIEAAEALYAAMAPLRDEVGRAEDLAWPHLDRATVDLARHDLPAAIRSAIAGAMATGSTAFYGAWLCAVVAGIARDEAAMRRAAEIMSASSTRGRYHAVVRRFVAAALGVFDGRVDEGLRELRAVADVTREFGVRTDLLLFRLATVALAPAGSPIRAEAAAEARELIDALDARALGGLLVALVPEGERATAHGRRSAGTGAPDGVTPTAR